MATRIQKTVKITCLLILVLMAACTQNTISLPKNTVNQPSISSGNLTLPQSENLPGNPHLNEGSLDKMPSGQPKIVYWSLCDAMWNWDWKLKRNELIDTNTEIYIMDPDGKNQVNLTNNPSMDLIPSLSPDGRRIVFYSDRNWEPDAKTDNNWDIFVMDTDGSNIKNLTGFKSWDSMPCWSPDGTMIAFCSNHATYWDIWVMDAEGKNFINLVPIRTVGMNFFPLWPSWSPDGTKIVFNSFEDGTYDVSVMEIDYNMLKQIVLNPTPGNCAGEEWSTTGGRKIVKPALTASGINSPNYNPITKGVGKLTMNPRGYDGKPSWSHDGKKIIYESCQEHFDPKTYDIFVMDADGNNKINLTSSLKISEKGVYNDWATFSPDGKKIAFASDRDGQPLAFGMPNPIGVLSSNYAWQIYVMNADGGNVTRITNNNFADGSPSWGYVPNDIADKIKEPPSQPISLGLPEAIISARDLEKIKAFYGKNVAVGGEVVDWGGTNDMQNRPILLYFDNPNEHCRTYSEWLTGACGVDFRVVIPIKDIKKFPDVYSYYGKKVRITGKIDYYKSAPCIIAQDPQQITIIK